MSNIALFLDWHLLSGQCSSQHVTASSWKSHQRFTPVINFWHRLLLAIVTLIRSNWISDCQYFWAADRHQETLHSITYACAGKRTVSGEWRTHWDAFAKDLLVRWWWRGCRAGAALWLSLEWPCTVLRQWRLCRSHIIKFIICDLSYMLRAVVLIINNSKANTWYFKGHGAS